MFSQSFVHSSVSFFFHPWTTVEQLYLYENVQMSVEVFKNNIEKQMKLSLFANVSLFQIMSAKHLETVSLMYPENIQSLWWAFLMYC